MSQDSMPVVEQPAQRQPLDEITKPLWRLSRADRRRILEPFVGRWIHVERWWGRVASMGDQVYRGELVAVATATTKSTADFLIIKTVEGSTWAISTAQVAYLRLAENTGVKTAASSMRREAKP